MKVALCVPVNGQPSWAFHESIVHFQAYHYANHPEVGILYLRPPRALPVDVARNYLAQNFLLTDCEYLWFVDQDAAFVPETLERLMSWGMPIVASLCMIRGSEACWPMLFAGWKGEEGDRGIIPVPEVYNWVISHFDYSTNRPQLCDPTDALFPISFAGCHCTLIHRSVLEAVEPPWFSGEPGKEDKHFYIKAIKQGIPAYADLSCLVSHVTDTRLIGAYDFMAHFIFYREWKGLDAEDW